MPLLFYGHLINDPKKRLYGEDLRPLESTIFDHYKIKGLAPWSETPYIANYWLIRRGYRTHPRFLHSCFAWHDDVGLEQTVFIPGKLNWREALVLARDAFETIIPSSIVFRLTNYKGMYVYD